MLWWPKNHNCEIQIKYIKKTHLNSQKGKLVTVAFKTTFGKVKSNLKGLVKSSKKKQRLYENVFEE